MIIKNLQSLSGFSGKRVILRLDLNVPIKDGKISNDFRIRQSLRTTRFLKEGGAKTIIISHIRATETDSLELVAAALKEYIPLAFAKDLEEMANMVEIMSDGSFVLLENIRRFPGEENNDPALATKLASFGDFYINDAFSVSHRSHASVVGIPLLLPSYVGFLMEEEIRNIAEAFSPQHPALFVLGGAKFSTKLILIEKFLKIYDFVFVCGALANNFFKEKGLEVGRSKIDASATLPGVLKPLLENPRLLLPSEVVVKNNQTISVKTPDKVSANDAILDAGSGAVANLATVLKEVKFVLWNGPLGEFENGFTSGTADFVKALAASGVRSMIGGGDTVAAVSTLGLEGVFSFVSTGGGAMLDFLANETLPGIEALKNSKS